MPARIRGLLEFLSDYVMLMLHNNKQRLIAD